MPSYTSVSSAIKKAKATLQKAKKTKKIPKRGNYVGRPKYNRVRVILHVYNKSYVQGRNVTGSVKSFVRIFDNEKKLVSYLTKKYAQINKTPGNKVVFVNSMYV